MMTIANNTESNNQDQSRGSSHPDLTQEASFSTTLHAQPYGDGQGFYFHSFEEYEALSEKCLDPWGNRLEEFELQFIDGELCDLWTACKINQSNLSVWFDEIELMDEQEQKALYFLCGVQGYSLDRGLELLEEPILFDGSAEDAAYDYFTECIEPSIPKGMQVLNTYFDHAAFARDLQLNSDFVEFEYRGETLCCTNASGI